jgi:thiol-disulfide isomerase/thioredoxin
MNRIVWWLCAGVLAAQTAAPAPSEEQQELSRALAEAGSSGHEFARALEEHLRKYPESKQRWEIERALVKTAREIGDDRRIVQWGEPVLARESEDLPTLEAVTRAYIRLGDKTSAERALLRGIRWEQILRSLEPKGQEKIRWQTRMDLDQGMSRALAAQARAKLILGKAAEGEALAVKGFEAYPFDETARVLALSLEMQNKWDAASVAWANAFVSGESKMMTDLDAMRATYQRAHGEEKGAGDRLLEAHDRFHRWNAAKIARLREYDPNALKLTPGEFVIRDVGGKQLDMKSLLGKVVVLDFWATWCGPCRTQHPLYEQAKKKFAGRNDIEFVYLNTDEDKALVAPFLEANQWSRNVYFEDGLSRLFNVSSIPTTIILNKRGEVASRMNVFNPERFVDMLSERIERILSE